MHLVITYILFFLGIFLEGELIFLSAVIAAHQGILNIWLVVIIAISATLTSDFFYFNLGKHKVKKWMANKKFVAKYEHVEKRLIKNRTKMLLSYRFIYGLRMITPFILGTQSLDLKTFLKYSIISTCLWCLLLVGLGYSLGELILNNLKHIEKLEYYVIASLIVIGLIIFILNWLKNKRPLKEK